MSTEQLQLFNIESFAPAPALKTDWAFDVTGDDDYDEEEYFTQTYRGHKAQFLKTKQEWRIAFIDPTRSESGLWTDTLDRAQAIRYFQQNVDNIIEYQQSSENLKQKSSHVQRNLVERANFQWVEEYPVKRGKYYYFRYCHLNDRDIAQVNKIHIPKGNVRTSIGQARADLVREAINSGSSPEAVVQMIQSW